MIDHSVPHRYDQSYCTTQKGVCQVYGSEKIASILSENAKLKRAVCEAFKEADQCEGCPYEWDCQSEVFPRYWKDLDQVTYEAAMAIRRSGVDVE